MSTLIEQILKKLGLDDEPKISSKTKELLRLLELRSSNIPSQINEYGKIVLCADIAASLLCNDFDKEQALNLSGLRKSCYANYKRLFEKLLDVNRLVGTKDICIQLGLSGVNQKADELLSLYGKTVGAENSDIDMKHPQYAAMAVFQACKLMKHKILKPKIMPYSNLRPSQWTLLEHRWDRFISQHYVNKFDAKTKDSPREELENKAKETEKLLPSKEKQSRVNEVEDYEDWKRRMLDIAKFKLKPLPVEMERENS